MKAFILGTSWSAADPEKIRVVLEVPATEAKARRSGTLAEDEVFVYPCTWWRLILDRMMH